MAKSKIKLLESDGKTWSFCHSDPMICKKHNHASSRKLAKVFHKHFLEIEQYDETVIQIEDSGVITYSDYLVKQSPIKGDKHFECNDCGINTLYCGEYYMVKDEIWNSVYSPNGMLCIGCLEIRLGKTLTRKDFTDAPINDINMGYKSKRIISRLEKR